MLSALGLAASLGGCATVVNGTHQDFTIASSPPGAEVRLSDGSSCVSTPCTLVLKRKHPLTATLAKPGYKTVSTVIKPSAYTLKALPFFGNALIGGLIGASVDLYYGSYLDLGPDPLLVNLEPTAATLAGVDPNASYGVPVPSYSAPAAYAPNADAPLALAGGPPTDAAWTPARQDQFDKAYRMGQTHALRQVCVGSGDQYWRVRMAGVIETQGGDRQFAHMLSVAFNQGYDAARAAFPSCDARARSEQARLEAARMALDNTTDALR